MVLDLVFSLDSVITAIGMADHLQRRDTGPRCDRGPFARNRIIDVSRQAATSLGFKGAGTAKVRVTVLPEESRRLKLAAINGSDTRLDEIQVAAAPRDAYRVVLDERGRAMASDAFAAKLADLRDAGTRAAAFVIGEADGLDESARAEADFVLALGPQTWPHKLVRVMIAEQLYRAVAILAGSPYHRGDPGAS